MKYFFLLLVPVLLFSSCDSLDVFADYDKETDFTQYKTYGFMTWPEQNDQMVNEINKNRILAAISSEMEARGFTKVDEGADMYVNFILIIEEKTGVQAYSDYYGGGYGGYGGYYYPMGYGYSQTRYIEYDYLRGTAIVDLFDSKTKSLVWQGTGIGTVDESNKNKERSINSAISKIFSRYPIARNSKK